MHTEPNPARHRLQGKDRRPAAPAASAVPLRMSVPAAAVVGTLAASFGTATAVAAEPEHHSVDLSGSLDTARLADALARANAARAAQSVPQYTVREGDTVWDIAYAHGLTPEDVLTWNGLSWSTVIHAGQSLRLGDTARPAAPEAAPAAPVHIVVAGDTLSGIAAQHGVPLHEVFAANDLDDASIIYPGQVVALPGQAPDAAQPAGTVNFLEVVTEEEPVAAPEAAAPAPAAAAPSPAALPPAQAHTVVAGDTLSGIAARYGLSLDAVFTANGLDEGSIIYPGQSVALPAENAIVAVPASAPAPAAAPAEIAPVPAVETVPGLDAEQTENARLIIQVGRDLGVSDRGIAIALATAMVESWVRNLDWGDRDSLGLFQQRPSQGWGSADQIRDAERSIRVFYGGEHNPNGSRSRGLLDIPGWESMPFSAAAQAVQISAYPERYGHWEADAYAWLAALG